MKNAGRVARPETVFRDSTPMELMQKLAVLADAAKYDASCSSSGGARRDSRAGKGVGSTEGMGICHSYTPDGRCVSLLKILLTNFCIFDCAYCVNRVSSNVRRARFSTEEVVQLTLDFYKRNYIEGLFLSSGIIVSGDYTMEQLVEVARSLREDHHFAGYIHLKTIPEASPELIEKAGRYADRLSINVELPTEEGLKALAPDKQVADIRGAMDSVHAGIVRNRAERREQTGQPLRRAKPPRFAPAGQSTQMIVGATPENDFQIMSVAESLYRKFELKRVFYSAFVKVNEDKDLPVLAGGPPLLREHRLYQADWLLRFYGFTADELLSEKRPNFNIMLDPKADWALRHLELFPVEVNRADYQMLLRIPGIGVKSAQRIVRARKNGALRFEDLKKIGVVLKRALYFITCGGRMMYNTKVEEDYITRNLLNVKEKLPFDKDGVTYKQLSLFDDMGITVAPRQEDLPKTVLGQM